VFSVNIDKLMKMTSLEAESYAESAQRIDTMLTPDEHILSVIGNGIAAFKLAASFMEQDKKVLFVDADIEQEIFLGKYKLGKNLKGIVDVVKEKAEPDDVICVTNRKNLDVVFTGSIEEGERVSIEDGGFRGALERYEEQYDLIVVLSDDLGNVAAICDKTVLIVEKNDYSELSADVRVKELDEKGCLVLGVIIDE
jgi:MinD-like ATPase involved in chromosome partitioning or flagellar assembly